MREGQLLDEIASMLGKMYLSDLHTVKIDDFILLIDKIDLYKYSVEQWNYAMSYILGISIRFNDAGEIKSVLLREKETRRTMKRK